MSLGKIRQCSNTKPVFLPTHSCLATVNKKKLGQSIGYLPLHPKPPPLPGPVKDKNEGLHAQELPKILRRPQQKIKPSVKSFWADEGEEGLWAMVQVTCPWSWSSCPPPQANRKGISFSTCSVFHSASASSCSKAGNTGAPEMWGPESRAVVPCTAELESHWELSLPCSGCWIHTGDTKRKLIQVKLNCSQQCRWIWALLLASPEPWSQIHQR